MSKDGVYPGVPDGMIDVTGDIKLSWARVGRVDNEEDYVHSLNLYEEFKFPGHSIELRIGDVGPNGIRLIGNDYRVIYHIDEFGQPGIKIMRSLEIVKRIREESQGYYDAWGIAVRKGIGSR